MDKDLRKIFTFPFIAITSIAGFVGAIMFFANFATDFRIKVIIVLAAIIIILTSIVVGLYMRIRKDEGEITNLKRNNSGLIQAKDKYLEENVRLKEEVGRHSISNSLLSNENDKLRNILTYVFMNKKDWDLGSNEIKIITDYISKGENYGKKELEGNKDN